MPPSLHKAQQDLEVPQTTLGRAEYTISVSAHPSKMGGEGEVGKEVGKGPHRFGKGTVGGQGN